MAENRNRTVFARRRATYIGTAVTMGILIIVSLCCIMHFKFLHRENIYLKQVIAILGMLFAAILFISCFINIRENTRQGRIFAVLSALLFIVILLSGIVDALDGIAGAGDLLVAAQTSISIISAIIHLLFWFYQCASLPKSRAQRYYIWWISILLSIYIGMLGVNAFTGFLFYADAFGRMHWPGEMIEFALTSMFYLLYLLYILPQRSLLKKTLLQVKRIKETYKPGMRVRLLKMDDIQAPPVGTEGTVRGVDDIGSVMVSWDNGSGLNVVLGENEIEAIGE